MGTALSPYAPIPSAKTLDGTHLGGPGLLNFLMKKKS